MLTSIRVDFYDLGDLQGMIYRMVSGFRYPHVGIMVGDMYLLPIIGERTQWRPVEIIDRAMSSKDRESFSLMADLDPVLTAMVGDGHVPSSRTWNTLTELPCYLHDVGFRVPSINRTTCATIVTAILRSAGVPVKASTARHLYEELRTASNFLRTDPLVTVELQANHQLQGRRSSGH